MNVMENFVWFKNTKVAVNLALVNSFQVDTISNADKKKQVLRFFIGSNTIYSLNISDKDDIDNFLQNVARV